MSCSSATAPLESKFPVSQHGAFSHSLVVT
jgi:hypothetical protein